MIAIVDYGVGNVRAFANIFKRLNLPHQIAKTPEKLLEASKVILPGVGAFDWAMQLLSNSGMREPLDELVIEKKTPVLGICVGMQLMADSSEEGRLPGLGWIKATVKQLGGSQRSPDMRLPHMGWNEAQSANQDGLFQNMTDSELFYFLHSYIFVPESSSEVLSQTDYHGDFTSAVRRENVYGVQFHPEKSHDAGVRLLSNFAAL